MKVQPERETSVESGMVKERAAPFPVVDIELNSTLLTVTLPGHALNSAIPPFPLVRVIDEKREEEREREESVYVEDDV